MKAGGWILPRTTDMPQEGRSLIPTRGPFLILWDGVAERGASLTRPLASITAAEDGLQLNVDAETLRWEGNPLLHLDEALSRGFAVAQALGHEHPCFAGVFHFDLRRCIERYPSPAPDDLALPWITGHVYGSVRPISVDDMAAWPSHCPPTLRWCTGPMDREAYEARVRRIVDLEYAGDVYQINLTRRLTAPLELDPFELWVGLARGAIAPFSAYLDVGGFQVLSLSPERFLAREGDRAWTEPIKGTAARGMTQEEDQAALAGLLAGEKEAAELAMIVDVERNDLGRVARPGSVRVPEHRRVLTLPTVHHLVSTVEADLRPGTGTADLLRATFPGGSVTGAPKIRAMQIIDELEPVSRGFYCGALGWVGPSGDLDLSLPIRCATAKDGQLHLGVGGGIVADSVPCAEWEETVAKARCFLSREA